MIKFLEEIDLEKYTLILPSVAVGNVAQLCVDLLISSLNLRKIGSIWSTSFVPIVGADPYDEDSSALCTASDFYVDSSKRVVLLQIRSPYVDGSTEFFDELASFVKAKKIGKVAVLTSSFDYQRRGDRSESATLYRYLASGDLPAAEPQVFQDLGWKKHEHTLLCTNPNETPPIIGGGFAKGLFDYLSRVSVPCALIFRYCSEGDNVSDASDFARNLNLWLRILETDGNAAPVVRYPPSWKHLFGNPPPAEVY